MAPAPRHGSSTLNAQLDGTSSLIPQPTAPLLEASEHPCSTLYVLLERSTRRTTFGSHPEHATSYVLSLTNYYYAFPNNPGTILIHNTIPVSTDKKRVRNVVSSYREGDGVAPYAQ